MTQFDTILSIFDDWYDAGKDPISWEDGMDIILEKTGAGLETKYTLTPAPVSKPVPPSAKSLLTDIDVFIKAKCEENLQKAIGALTALTGGTISGSSIANQLTSQTGSQEQTMKTIEQKPSAEAEVETDVTRNRGTGNSRTCKRGNY